MAKAANLVKVMGLEEALKKKKAEDAKKRRARAKEWKELKRIYYWLADVQIDRLRTTRGTPIRTIMRLALQTVEEGAGYLRIGVRMGSKPGACWFCGCAVEKYDTAVSLADVDGNKPTAYLLACRRCWPKFWDTCLRWRRRRPEEYRPQRYD